MHSLILSGLALALSITTAWLTLSRRGKLRMPQPLLVGFLFYPDFQFPDAWRDEGADDWQHSADERIGI
jgi:hypothetical protein